MEACEVVRLFVNKKVVPAEPIRPGNPGYGPLKALRVLVYSRLKGLENDTRIVEHLEKHRWAVRVLGLPSVPDRTTVGRWWRRYLSFLEEVFKRIADLLQLLAPTTYLIADSTPLEDIYDLEAEWGHTSEGWFRGFKLHSSVNQLGLPLRAVFTPGNRHDSPLFPSLIKDLEAKYVLADAGYDSMRNIRAVRAMGAEPVIASNPRRGRHRRVRHAELLRAKRYVVEQFNGHIKENVLKWCWIRPRGLVKKAAMVTAGLICVDAEAMNAMLQGETSLKNVSKYWA
jgi:putative transposase